MPSLMERIRRSVSEAVNAAHSGPAARKSLARRYAFRAMEHLTPTVAVPTPDGTIFVPTADRTVGRAVFADGGWERDLLPRAVAWSGADLSAATFLEVGANIGTTTLPAARLAAQVIAVEPAAANLRLLRATLAANELAHVRVVAVACSDGAGEGWLSLSPVNWGDHRVVEAGDVRVALRTVDDIVREVGGPDVGMMWVDTQGHEARVLAGARQTLASMPPLLIEFWPPVLGDGVAGFLDAVAHYPRCRDMSTGRDVADRAGLAGRYRDTSTDLLFTAQ